MNFHTPIIDMRLKLLPQYIAYRIQWIATAGCLPEKKPFKDMEELGMLFIERMGPIARTTRYYMLTFDQWLAEHGYQNLF